ncbi:MAG TPA: DUF6798 domain-containing protein [Xenococcaceae cyanobacterium]
MRHISAYFRKNDLRAAILFSFISLRLLLDSNMSGLVWNEVDVLPLARQFVDPSWIAKDWYLNLDTNYRYLFQIIFGFLSVHLGFLVTSIIGRLVCYALVAWGIVLLGQKLGLNSVYLLLVTVVITYQGSWQGAIAGEWFVGGLEAKAVAYGLILIAIPLMLSRSYILMSLLLGLATSFHVLVGGWALVTTVGWLAFRPQERLLKLGKKIWLLLLIYLAASAFALPAILHQLATASLPGNISPSFIYVFLRLPHHLNPFAWHPLLWLKFGIYFGLWIICIISLQQNAKVQGWNLETSARFELAEFTFIALIPFFAGMAIAFFDVQGEWLQYYPFRFGDIMLPLTTCLLVACNLQSLFSRSSSKMRRFMAQYLGLQKHKLHFLLVALLGCILFTQISLFTQRAIAYQDFPAQQQDVTPQWKLMSDWIHDHTAKEAIIISHPWQLANFTWMTERATIVKLKLFPQTSQSIVEYYERLNDLSAGALANIYFGEAELNQRKTVKAISAGFSHLNTAQVRQLMMKYQANYFLTDESHHLDLPIIHVQTPYILYGNPDALSPKISLAADYPGLPVGKRYHWKVIYNHNELETDGKTNATVLRFNQFTPDSLISLEKLALLI